MSEEGGVPTLVSAPAEGEFYRGFPSHLPGDRGVLVMFGAALGTENTRVAMWISRPGS